MIGEPAILSAQLNKNLYLTLLVAILIFAAVSPLIGYTQTLHDTSPTVQNSDMVDGDGDGLPDFQETHKYLTNPAIKDTDGDGLPDGNWNERREYTYSIRSILQFMPPFDKATLNDDFQDARVLEEGDDYIELEVIHYPFSTAGQSIDPNPNWQQDYSHMTEYLRPGITTNWDAEMKQGLLAELQVDGILIDTLTDKQVVERVSSWLMKKSKSLDKVFTTYHVHFPNGQPSVYPGLEENFEREFNRDKDNYDWAMEQHFDHELLGKGMFYNKTRGSCTSFAVYLTTVLRAVGIPAHLYTFKDLSEANLAPTWGWRYGKNEKTAIFKHNNPYSAIELSDLFGRHSNIPNPVAHIKEHKQLKSSASLPNIFILCPPSIPVFAEIIDIVKAGTRSKTGRSHGKKSYDSIFIEGIWGRKPGDIIVLLFSLETDDRVPSEYEDLLPVAWPEIESALKQGKSLELKSDARKMNIIVLAAPTTEKLGHLVRKSSLLKAIGGKDKKPDVPLPDEKWTRTGRTKEPAAYTVTITQDNWRKAVVNCRIVTDGDLSLWMNNNGAPQVPNGHASFVRNLKAVDSAGKKVPIKDYGQARWRMPPADNQPVTLSYEVLLEHDKSDLPWGPDEAPYVTEDGAFWTGRALFIVAEMNNITLRFDLPDQWHVSTQWQPAPGKASAFSLKDADELTEAFIFAGTHIEERARVGDMEIALALGTKMEPSKELLKAASQKLLNCCVELFGYMGLDLRKQIIEALPDRDYVIHRMLHIMSLRQTQNTLLILRSQEAGYQDDDLLTAIDGMPVGSFRDIQTVAKRLEPGDKIEVALLRAGKKVTLELDVGGEEQRIPLERKIEVTINKKARLNSSQKAILSGIIGKQ